MKKMMMVMAAAAVMVAGSMGAKAQSADRPLKLQFHHATLSVANIEAEVEWYKQKLGFEYKPGETIKQLNPMMKGTRLVIPGFQLDFIQWKGSERPKSNGNVLTVQGLAHLVFVTPDVEGTMAALKAAGIEVHGNGGPGGKVMGFTFADPEGNEIEVTAQ